MKKLLIMSLIGAVSLLSIGAAHARQPEEIRAKLEAKRKDKAAAQTSSQKAENARKVAPRAISVYGEVVSISGAAIPAELVIKVTKVASKQPKKWDGAYPEVNKEFKVKVDGQTTFARRFGGNGSLGEFAVGDKVRIVVKVHEDGAFTARMVKNASILRAWRSGVIQSIDAAAMSFVIKRGDHNWTVKTSAETKFSSKDEQRAFADLKVGDKITTRGIVNLQSKEVMAKTVSVMKSASHPATATPTPAAAN